MAHDALRFDPLLARLRLQARSARRGTDVGHAQALNSLARDAGYRDWRDLVTGRCEYVAQLKRAPVTVLALPSRDRSIFHRVAIEGLVFCGRVYSNLFIEREDGRGQVQIGASHGINYFARSRPGDILSGDSGWWVCKYRNQQRVDLRGLSERGIAALAYEFGLPVFVPGWPQIRGRIQPFFGSPALDALQAWARRHPRLFAQEHGVDSYVGSWADAVRGTLVTAPISRLGEHESGPDDSE